MKAATTDAQFYAKAHISENIVETPEGFLLAVNVPIARPGELEYLEGELVDDEGNEVIEALNGKITITRGEDDLFSIKTMASFEGKAITIGHPADFVSPATWKSVSVGHMQNVRRGEGEMDGKLVADLLFTDEFGISSIRAGLREISLGYDAEYEQTEPGFGTQTSIVGNHVALVRKGRNGSGVAVRDSAPDPKSRRQTMATETKKPAVAAKPKISFKDSILKAFGKALDEMPQDETASAEDNSPEARIARIEDMVAQLANIKTPDEEGAVVEEETNDNAMEERLATLEAAIAKLLEGAGPTTDAFPEKKDAEKTNDAKAKDQSSVVLCEDADVLARAEILVPGIENSATLIEDAIEKFRKTKDGAAVLTTLDSIKEPKSLLVAASELVRGKRGNGLSTVTIDAFPSLSAKGPVTAEDINAINAKRWGSK